MNQKSQSSSAQTAKPQPGAPPSGFYPKTATKPLVSFRPAQLKMRALGSQAKDMASDVANQVAQSAERQFAGGKDRAAEAINQIAGALRRDR